MSHIKITFLVILFTITGFCSLAQNYSQTDSVFVYPKKKEHSAHKATIYSAVLPGLGQIYNRKWWKVPAIYIGFGALAYSIDWNNDLYVSYKQAYADIRDNDPNTNFFKELKGLEGVYDFNNPQQMSQLADKLKLAKDNSRRYRDLAIIGTAAFYALNIIDASVDAHLFNFDISDDLTFNWGPTPVFYANQPVVGLRCNFRF